MSNDQLKIYHTTELIAELVRRGAFVSVGDSGMYPLDKAEIYFSADYSRFATPRIKIPDDATHTGAARGRHSQSAFDADQYFLDLVERGVSTVDARRLANLAADVDALVGSLVKENRR